MEQVDSSKLEAFANDNLCHRHLLYTVTIQLTLKQYKIELPVGYTFKQNFFFL